MKLLTSEDIRGYNKNTSTVYYTIFNAIYLPFSPKCQTFLISYFC